MSCKIEILYPEACNLMGDDGNIRYLKECLKDAEFIETSLNDTPHFVSGDVSLIYIGSMTEKTQEMVIDRLMPYRERLAELIDNGTYFLMTGNSFEVFGKEINDVETGSIKCLDLLDFNVKRNIMNRRYSFLIGKHEDITMVGFRAQFTECYLGAGEKPFMEMEKGDGMNSGSNAEGIVRNNFYCTYCIGPILILNPQFTKMLFRKITGKDIPLVFEKEITDAYNTRLAEFRRDDKKIH